MIYMFVPLSAIANSKKRLNLHIEQTNIKNDDTNVSKVLITTEYLPLHKLEIIHVASRY